MYEYARYCIQCQDKKSGAIGDFIFTDDAYKIAISPVFLDLQQLYHWMGEQGWEHTSDGEWNSIRRQARTETKK